MISNLFVIAVSAQLCLKTVDTQCNQPRTIFYKEREKIKVFDSMQRCERYIKNLEPYRATFGLLETFEYRCLPVRKG